MLSIKQAIGVALSIALMIGAYVPTRAAESSITKECDYVEIFRSQLTTEEQKRFDENVAIAKLGARVGDALCVGESNAVLEDERGVLYVEVTEENERRVQTRGTWYLKINRTYTFYYKGGFLGLQKINTFSVYLEAD